MSSISPLIFDDTRCCFHRFVFVYYPSLGQTLMFNLYTAVITTRRHMHVARIHTRAHIDMHTPTCAQKFIVCARSRRVTRQRQTVTDLDRVCLSWSHFYFLSTSQFAYARLCVCSMCVQYMFNSIYKFNINSIQYI